MRAKKRRARVPSMSEGGEQSSSEGCESESESESEGE